MKPISFVRAGLPLVCVALSCAALAPAAMGQQTKVQSVQQAERMKQIMSELDADIERAARGRAAAEAEARQRAARLREALDAPPQVPATQRAAGLPAAPGGSSASPVNGATGVAAAPVIGPMSSEQRVALVIGNANYKTSPLTNPTNDARAMAIRLQQLGFTVIKRENASMEEMMSAVRDFGNQIKNGGIGLFYYAGHGVQSKGINYLLPIDANISNEDELATRAYNANEVLEKMDTAKNRINLVILDACRDNPFARSFRSASRGLAGMETAPRGTLVAYATSPGSTAADGTGANGLYTEQLLAAMADPGVKVEDVFKRVREGVQERSGGKQTPWEMSSITGNFYFSPTAEQAALPVASGSGGGPRMASMARQMMPVLMPRKLIENYQLAGNFNLAAGTTAGRFSSTGEHLALATRDRALHVWNSASGLAEAGDANFGEASLSGDGRFLLGVNGGEVHITDLQQEARARVVTGLPKAIQLAALSPNGKRLLVYTRDKGYSLYDTDTSRLVAELDEVDGEPRFLFSPNGHRLLTWGARDSNMKLWEPEQGKKVSRLTKHWKPIGFVRFSHDGAHLFTAALNDKAVLWRTSDGDDVRSFSFGDGNPLPLMGDLFDDGKRLLAYVPRGLKPPQPDPLQLGVWDATSGSLLTTLVGDGITVRKYRFSPDRARLFVDTSDNSLQVFDTRTLKRISMMAGAELLHFSPDGRRVIVKGREGVRLLDALTLSPLARMPGQVDAFVSHKGGLFITCAADGMLTLWNIDTGHEIGQLKGHLDPVTTAVFSDDGRRLVTVGTDNVAKLWALPVIKNMEQLVKDQFESTGDYQKRLTNWSSPYTSLVTLAGYNADAETFSLKIGDIGFDVPLARDAARKLAGQRQAVVTGKLQFFDSDQLVLAEPKLNRLP